MPIAAPFEADLSLEPTESADDSTRHAMIFEVARFTAEDPGLAPQCRRPRRHWGSRGSFLPGSILGSSFRHRNCRLASFAGTSRTLQWRLDWRCFCSSGRCHFRGA